MTTNTISHNLVQKLNENAVSLHDGVLEATEAQTSLKQASVGRKRPKITGNATLPLVKNIYTHKTNFPLFLRYASL